MLSSRWSADRLREVLLPREAWRPYPQADDRAAWSAVPAEEREARVEKAESLLGCEWPPTPAVRFLDYVRDGDRERYQTLSFSRRAMLRDLVLAECMEARGRFIDDMVNGVWVICEESFWGVPAHVGVQKAGPGLPDVTEPIIDLFAAETAALLAWTLYLLGPALDNVSPLIGQRIGLEIDRRILTPLLERDDFRWMGFHGGRRVNNWNPWIHSNGLTCALLCESDPERRLVVCQLRRRLGHRLASGGAGVRVRPAHR